MGVLPKNLVIMAAVANEAQEWGIDATITSGNDSKHGVGSLHYSNEALDIRSKTFLTHEQKLRFLYGVMGRLGSGRVKEEFAESRVAYHAGAYYGELEHEGLANEHFHIEYDPT